MIFRSPYADVRIPDVPFHTCVLEHAADHPDRPALIDAASGRSLTHGGLVAGVRRAATGFAAHGIRTGDVIAICSPNLPEYAVAFLGGNAAGAAITTINPLHTAAEIEAQLRDSRARLLITVPPLLDRCTEAAHAAGIEHVFVFGNAEGATPFAALLDHGDAPPDLRIDPATDLAALPYSSGTTGLPKGVMLTHRNLVANLAQLAAADSYEVHEIAIGVLPFYHIYGMVVVMGGIVRIGGTVVTMPRFELEPFLEASQRHRATIAYLVPPIVLALSTHPLVDRYDLSSLRLITSGAAALPPAVAERCAARIGCTVRQGYGLTETSPVTHLNPVDPPVRNRRDAVGVAVPNTLVRIADPVTGESLGPGAEGEVQVKGPQVMSGYLGDDAANARTFTRDGWLRTGDVGRVDAESYLVLVDRAKEMIKYKGMQVAPAELEAVLLSHPAVADAAVIGSPDPEAGEVPKAFVVLRTAIAGEEIMAWVAERVAPYKKVRRIEVREIIPKSPSGKILRRVLVEEERRLAAAG